MIYYYLSTSGRSESRSSGEGVTTLSLWNPQRAEQRWERKRAPRGEALGRSAVLRSGPDWHAIHEAAAWGSQSQHNYIQLVPLAGLSDLGGADSKSARHCFPGLRGGVDTHSWGRSVLGQPGPVHLLLFCHQHLVIPPVVHFANMLSLCQPLSYGHTGVLTLTTGRLAFTVSQTLFSMPYMCSHFWFPNNSVQKVQPSPNFTVEATETQGDWRTGPRSQGFAHRKINCKTELSPLHAPPPKPIHRKSSALNVWLQTDPRAFLYQLSTFQNTIACSISDSHLIASNIWHIFLLNATAKPAAA